MVRVDVVGSGAWGTTLTALIASKGSDVRLVCRRQELADEIRRRGENSAHLPGGKLPRQIEISSLAENPFYDSTHVVLAITSQHMREMLEQPPFRCLGEAFVLNATKGLEYKQKGNYSGKRMSQVISESLKLNAKYPVSVLSGPNLASEIAAGQYAATVIACEDAAIAQGWRNIFKVPGRFAPDVSDDVVGVELGGALKNIVAIACGMVDGLGLGDNTKAAVIAHGLVDLVAIGECYGARRETFYGISGIADINATCYSNRSRNLLVGERVAQGKALDVVLHELSAEMRGEPEGPETVRVIYALNGGLVLPTVKAVHGVLYAHADPRQSIMSILESPLRQPEQRFK